MTQKRKHPKTAEQPPGATADAGLAPADRIPARPTRIFVLHSFLGWAVDSIDMYLSLLNRKPNYLQDVAVASKLDGAGRLVLRKVVLIGDHYRVHPATLALIDVLITWRNNVFHELADNRVRAESEEAIAQHSSHIEANYRGLVAAELPVKALEARSLTFKETASLINAAHNFVQEVDSAILSTFDPVAFCREAVVDALNDREQETGFAAKYHSLPMDKRRRFLRNWLMNKFGFTDPADETLNQCLNLRRVTVSSRGDR